MAFEQNFIVELKARADLVSVISSVVQLKRAGSNLVGLCPFHSERTPSFTVFEATESYYCFGCGEGGDVITFVMKTEHVDYPTAVEMLAARVGIQVPEQRVYGGKKVNRNRFFELNRRAAQLFHETLLSEQGRQGLTYLTETRGLSMGVIRHFGLGYATESWDALTKALCAEGFTEEELQAAFLAGKGRGGGSFDYFRGRVIFPIIDVSGRVIGFGGRIIGDGTPKYLNSSDTPVFKKRMNLYALNFAKLSTEKSLIFCEGYMDVIALHAAGFTHAVATLGTAITPEQARLCKRYADTAYLCYDADEAGQRATNKAIELLEAADVQVRVVTLKDAKDPDEFIRAFGKEAFSKALKLSDGHIEYAFSRLARGYDLSVAEDKLRFVKAACGMLAGIASPLEREVYIDRLANMTDLDKDTLRTQIKRILRGRGAEERRKAQESQLQKIAGYGDKLNPEKTKYPSAAVLEEQILGILFLYPEYFAQKESQQCISEEAFLCEANRKLFCALRDTQEKYDSADIAFLAETLSPEEISALMRMRMNREKLSDNSVLVLQELTCRLAKIAARTRGADDDINAALEHIRKQKKG